MSVDSKYSSIEHAAWNLLGGCLSGIISRFLVHPFDTLRTRAIAGLSRPPLRSVFRGSLVSFLLSGPATAVYLLTYDYCKVLLSHKTQIVSMHSPLLHFAAAIAAEAVSGLLWTPMEVIKQKMQAGLTPNYTMAALQRGYGANMLAFAPYSVLFWLGFERIKKTNAFLEFEKVRPFEAFAVSSMAAAAFAAAATAPLDYVKTRVQVGSDPSVLSAVRNARWKEVGKGAAWRVMYVAPGTMISVTFFELWKKYTTWNE